MNHGQHPEETEREMARPVPRPGREGARSSLRPEGRRAAVADKRRVSKSARGVDRSRAVDGDLGRVVSAVARGSGSTQALHVRPVRRCGAPADSSELANCVVGTNHPCRCCHLGCAADGGWVGCPYRPEGAPSAQHDSRPCCQGSPSPIQSGCRCAAATWREPGQAISERGRGNSAGECSRKIECSCSCWPIAA
jgi:hypothetical protein